MGDSNDNATDGELGRPLRVLVADDELLARKRLVRLLSAFDDAEVVGTCENGEEVLRRVRDASAPPVDVILLDIHMPGLTGMEALSLMGEDGPTVIFCTAFPDHAVEAFEHGAVDYLLKPVDAARLKKALDRARGQSSPPPRSTPANTQEAPPLARLPISTRKGIILVDLNRVSHALLEDELVVVSTVDDRYLTDFTLNALEEKLPAARFERVHRRAIVNLERVQTLEPLSTGGYTARMENGDVVSISRQSARKLRKRLGL